MNTKQTGGRISDPDNPFVESYHKLGSDMQALEQALGGIKGTSSSFVNLRKSLKFQISDIRYRRAEVLRSMHIVDQDNKNRS